MSLVEPEHQAILALLGRSSGAGNSATQDAAPLEDGRCLIACDASIHPQGWMGWGVALIYPDIIFQHWGRVRAAGPMRKSSVAEGMALAAALILAPWQSPLTVMSDCLSVIAQYEQGRKPKGLPQNYWDAIVRTAADKAATLVHGSNKERSIRHAHHLARFAAGCRPTLPQDPNLATITARSPGVLTAAQWDVAVELGIVDRFRGH